jgi:hypothetical protein
MVSNALKHAPLFLFALTLHAQSQDTFLSGRPVPDAHNCYPEQGRWTDRIERALTIRFPVAIEQDLAWYVDPATGQGRVVVSHTAQPTGSEPTLRQYFFERVRPIVEKALVENKRDTWPLIVLHFDFKDNQPALLHAVWNQLDDFLPWITTSTKGSDPQRLMPFDPKPLLVLTEDSDAQEKVFFDEVPVGARLRLFGSAHTASIDEKRQAERNHLLATLPPERLLAAGPTNYRRWWNNSWYLVEEGGASRAGDWTPADESRLKALCDRAHHLAFWIRFYTLDGFAPAENHGWGADYNFGSAAAARLRWQAALAAGVNLIATDQYEDFGALLNRGADAR